MDVTPSPQNLKARVVNPANVWAHTDMRAQTKQSEAKRSAPPPRPTPPSDDLPGARSIDPLIDPDSARKPGIGPFFTAQS